MTALKKMIFTYVCDVDGCKATMEGNEVHTFWDKHLCHYHFNLLKPETREKLQGAADDVVRESHEGGTPHFGRAQYELNQIWNAALQEIRIAENVRVE